jgi:hypothetical protein
MHLHKWSIWTEAHGTFDSPLFPKLGSWREMVQVRKCQKCGKIDVKRMK